MSAVGISRISALLGFNLGSTSFNYLFKGKPKKVHLMPIADRIMVKLSSWKGALLSIMGRVELVKSVIFGIMLYNFKVYSWPVS